MEDAPGDQATPKGTSRESDGDDHDDVSGVHAENHEHDVDKTLYDAEEFLSNFAGLREENEQLKAANHQLELQLDKARQDLQELSIEKDSLENTILQEREQNKEILWKLRSDFQKVQEERLQWKEKYLDSCMQSSCQPTGLQSPSKSQSLKRKSQQALVPDGDNFYTSLTNAFGLTDQEQQPEEVILTLISEDSKSYKISIRECSYCGIGFCSAIALNEHSRSCPKRPYKASVTTNNQIVENAVDCAACNVKFPSHADLIQHNQYHQGTHKFLCRICNRSYQSNPGRLKHEQLEHGSLPLLHCDACGKQFKRKDRLKDHIATKHSVATPHKCPYCDGAFKLRDYLRKHVNQFHPGKTLSMPTTMTLKSDFKKEFLIKADGDSGGENHEHELHVHEVHDVVGLVDVVAGKYSDDTNDSSPHQHDHHRDVVEHHVDHEKTTLTLTNISIKSDREETVTTADYNHLQANLANNISVVEVQENDMDDAEMVDAEEVHIIIDTGGGSGDE